MTSRKATGTPPKYDPVLFDHCARWDLTLDSKQEERVVQTLRLVPETARDLLDVGCGDGSITLRLPRRGRVIGCDSSLTGLRMMEVTGVCGSLQDLPFADRSFDLVSAFEVLEHLPPSLLPQACAEIGRVARDHILLSVPNREDLESRLGRCSACGRVFHVYNHLSSFNRDSIRTLFPGFGLKILEVTPHRRAGVERLPRWLRTAGIPLYAWAPHITCPECHTTNSPPSTLQVWGLRLTRVIKMMTFWWHFPGGWILALFERTASGR